MLLRKFWSIIGVSLLLAACGGGASSPATGDNGSGTGGSGGPTTPGTQQALDDLIASGGIYIVNTEEVGNTNFQLTYAAMTGNPANAYHYSIVDKVFTQSATSQTNYKVLEANGTWTEKTESDDVGALKDTDGKFTYYSSSGKAELILNLTEDLTGQKMVNASLMLPCCARGFLYQKDPPSLLALSELN